MLHTPNIGLTGLCAEALGIPLFLGSTEGEKETELEDIRQTIKSAKEMYQFDVLGTGGIASNYQKKRIDRILMDCNVHPLTPLWGINQESYMLELLRIGYNFIITSVSAEGLDESWLNRKIDIPSVLELIRLSKHHGFNVALEGGEGETLVLDCPLYREFRIDIIEATKVWEGDSGFLHIAKASLVKKDLKDSELKSIQA